LERKMKEATHFSGRGTVARPNLVSLTSDTETERGKKEAHVGGQKLRVFHKKEFG